LIRAGKSNNIDDVILSEAKDPYDAEERCFADIRKPIADGE
jgi:hypothetical protein